VVEKIVTGKMEKILRRKIVCMNSASFAMKGSGEGPSSPRGLENWGKISLCGGSRVSR